MDLYRSFVIPLGVLTTIFLALWYSNRPTPIPQSSMAQVHQEAETGRYQLMDAVTLWHLYQTDRNNLLLVDTRQEWEYNTGHITGSLNFPMEPKWWARWMGRGKLYALLTPYKENTIVFY